MGGGVSSFTAYALDDPWFRDRVAKIIVDNNLDTVVETGVGEGKSAPGFCQMARYFGIDIDSECVEKARRELSNATNWDVIHGHSPEEIRQLVINGDIDAEKTFFFLDAHRYKNWPCPILDEIDAIPRNSGVICIHDFWVPGRDQGGWGDLNYDYVRPALDQWSKSHRVEYMDKWQYDDSPGAVFVYSR